jgi:DNA-binding NtrC family response regulator
VLKTILEDEGYAVDTAGSGKEAIRKSHRKFYNLALIDIRLPDMEGVKLLKKMRDTMPKMRKIVVTGYPSIQSAIEAVNQGAHCYIVKPFDMREVLAAIKKQLREQEKEKKYSQEKVKEFIETRVMELKEQKVST